MCEQMHTDIGYLKRRAKIVEDSGLQSKFFATFYRVRQSQRDKEWLEGRYLYKNTQSLTIVITNNHNTKG